MFLYFRLAHTIKRIHLQVTMINEPMKKDEHITTICLNRVRTVRLTSRTLQKTQLRQPSINIRFTHLIYSYMTSNISHIPGKAPDNTTIVLHSVLGITLSRVRTNVSL